MFRLFTFLIACLLFLVAGTGVLWITSYFVNNSTYQHGPRIMFVRIDEGDNFLFLRKGAVELAILASNDHQWYSEGIDPFWKLELWLLFPAGVCFVIRRMSNPDRFSMVRGVCRVCGYDLRASRDRCPECGAEK